MTTAAADRLAHHAVIPELNRPSYRAEKARQARPAIVEAEGGKTR